MMSLAPSSMDCFQGAEILDLVAAIFTDTGIAVDLSSLLISDFLFAVDSVDICSSMDCFRRVEILDLIMAGSVDTLMDKGMEGLVITAGFTVDSTGMDESKLDIKDAINGVDVDSSVFHNVLFIFFLGRGFSSREESTFTVFLYTEGVDIIDFALYMAGVYFTGFKLWKCLLVWSKKIFTQIS